MEGMVVMEDPELLHTEVTVVMEDTGTVLMDLRPQGHTRTDGDHDSVIS
jgi:hypothetical protein